MAKTDPFSGETFEPKRSNQIFAARKNQIAYNNKIAKEKRRAKAFIEKPLDKNRNILKRLLGKNNSVAFSCEYLAGAGYDFNMFTTAHKEGENVRWGVYEFSLIGIENNKFKILKNYE